MSWIQKKIFSLCIFAMAIAAVTLGSPATAQDTNIRSVTFYTVKPDRVGDFQAEVKEYNAILAKAGSTGYSSMWASLTGPREYVRVQMYSKWADLDAGPDPKTKDQAADLTRIGLRIIACTESSHRSIDVVMPEFNVDSGVVPKMIRVIVNQVRPDKVHDYLDLEKNGIFPAIQKSGTKDYNFAETRYGVEGPQFVSVTGFSNWADLDVAIGAQKGLSQDDFQALLTKVRALIVQSQYIVYRYEPDLSYLPPTAAK